MLPYLINWGPLKISSFGSFMFLAFVFGLFISWREARDRGLDDDRFFDATLLATVAAFVGARLGYVISRLGDFTDNILKIFVIWYYPGLSLWGAIFCGLVGGFILARRHKLSLNKYADALAIGSLYAYFILYLGAVLDGGLTGKTTNLFLGILQPGLTGKRYPVAIFGATLSAIYILLLVLIKRRKSKLKPGTIFWVILSGIGLTEMLLAFIRDNLLYLDGLSVHLLLATVLFVAPWGPLFVIWEGKEWLGKIGEKIGKKL